VTNWEGLANRVTRTVTQKLGVPVEYQHTEQNERYEVKGVWTESSTTVDVNLQVPISSVNPRLGVRLADLRYPPDTGDFVIKKETRYRVIDVSPDGQGAAVLTLERI